ncbi:dihydropteroate synthase [Escherichia coli]|uniref:dihydropteroate synthase n=1 Tax=Escherichia coli TaxID=562 RepID=UPI00388F865D
MASPPPHRSPSTRRRAREIVRFFEARVSALRRSGVAADRLILDPGMGFFLSPAPETSLHVLSNLQKLKSALGLPLLVSVSRKSFLGATVGLPVKDLGPASLAAELHAIGNGADYVRTHAPEICEAQSPSRKPSRNFAVATPETEG